MNYELILPRHGAAVIQIRPPQADTDIMNYEL